MTKIYRRLAAAILPLFLITGSLPALAQQSDTLRSELRAFLVQAKENGEEVLTETREASPGDTIEYRLTYSNVGKQSVSGLTVVGPVPEQTDYVAGSARSSIDSSMEVSVDGGASWHEEPVMQSVKRAGSTVKEAVSPSNYNALQWTASGVLKGGSSANYVYRVKVK